MNPIQPMPTCASWTPIGDIGMRTIAATGGRIAYIEVSPKDAPARLTIRVTDASGAIDCIFLGRRLIAGLEPGVIVGIEGRVAQGAGVPVIFNPRYELRLA